MLEAAEADLALEVGFVHVKARHAFPEIARQARRREQTAFRASRWRRRSCRALPDAPAPPKLRDRVRGWDLELKSGLLQRRVACEPGVFGRASHRLARSLRRAFCFSPNEPLYLYHHPPADAQRSRLTLV